MSLWKESGIIIDKQLGRLMTIIDEIVFVLIGPLRSRAAGVASETDREKMRRSMVWIGHIIIR